MADNPQAFPGCRFYVQFDAEMAAVFTEVSGLQVEMETYDYEEGGNNDFVHRLPGRVKVSNITLKHGLVSSNQFLKWFMRSVQQEVTRKNVSVIMYDSVGQPVVRWNFLSAYPVKWTGPQFSADGSSVGVESLELAHSGMTVE